MEAKRDDFVVIKVRERGEIRQDKLSDARGLNGVREAVAMWYLCLTPT